MIQFFGWSGRFEPVKHEQTAIRERKGKMKGKYFGWLLGASLAISTLAPAATVLADEQPASPAWSFDLDVDQISDSTRKFVLQKAEDSFSNEASDVDFEEYVHQILDPFAFMDPSTIGALGFFLYEKDYDAALILAQSIQTGENKLNDANDAMTMEHFKQSLSYVDDCNRLRKSEGVSDLKIALPLMAISIVQTNTSAHTGNHSQIYPVGENLAWGYSIGTPMGQGNPFDGWYTAEKNEYEKTHDRSVAGHYFNIIESKYGYTGAAISTNATIGMTYPTCFGQVFEYSGSNFDAFTSDQVRSKIAAYEKALDDGSALPKIDGYNAMFRLYNPNSGEHFYTASFAEKKALVSHGWSYEGFGWYAPAKSSQPVYRLYNPNSGDHHYTINPDERTHLVQVGWKDEGTGWYSETEADAIPVYRQYNPNARKAGSHNYTTNKKEADGLVTRGWKDEGVGWGASYGWNVQ